jgi:hypothetical protein
MTELELLKSELPQLRALAQSINLDNGCALSEQERVRLGSEIRWCIDALTELGVRLKVAQTRPAGA